MKHSQFQEWHYHVTRFVKENAPEERWCAELIDGPGDKVACAYGPTKQEAYKKALFIQACSKLSNEQFSALIEPRIQKQLDADRDEHRDEIRSVMRIFEQAMDAIGAKCAGSMWNKVIEPVKEGKYFTFYVDCENLLYVKWRNDKGQEEGYEIGIDSVEQIIEDLRQIDTRLV